MREILFRAKKKYGRTWEYGSLGISRGRYYISEPEFSSQYQVLPDTVCQYTGVTDENGNKVFEGDIVETQYGRMYKVEYHILPDRVGFDLTPINGDHKVPDASITWIMENIKVVGNVFDGASKNDT